MSETLQQKMARIAAENKNPTDSAPKVTEASGAQNNTPADVVLIEPETSVVKDRVYHVFYCTIKNCRMVTKGGQGISFVNGKYITDNKADIEYLQEELSIGNMYLSVLEGKETQTESDLDPMKVLREEHYAEFLADQAEVARKKSLGIPLSVSESQVQPLTPGSSVDIEDMAEGNE